MAYIDEKQQAAFRRMIWDLLRERGFQCAGVDGATDVELCYDRDLKGRPYNVEVSCISHSEDYEADPTAADWQVTMWPGRIADHLEAGEGKTSIACFDGLHAFDAVRIAIDLLGLPLK